MSAYNKERLKLYGDDDRIVAEYMTIDTTEIKIFRIVMLVTDVLSKVGGMQHLIVLVLGFFFSKYTEINYLEEAIHDLYKIKTEDKTIFNANQQVKLSFLDKVKIITSCGINLRKYRFIERGFNKLANQFDMYTIALDIHHLKCSIGHHHENEIDLDKDSSEPDLGVLQLVKKSFKSEPNTNV